MKFDPKWLDDAPAQFQIRIERWLREMKGIKYLKSTRIEHVQAAVDVVSSYAEFHDGSQWRFNPHWNSLSGRYKAIFEEPLPVPRGTVKQKMAQREIVASKIQLLEEKIELLEYWAKTMSGGASSSSDNPLAEPGFLQGEESAVQEVLDELLEDAQRKVGAQAKEPWMKEWHGIRGDKSVTWTKERLERAVSAKASFDAGLLVTGELSIEYKFFKGTVKTELFTGARGKASASATASLKDLNLDAKLAASAEVGIRVKAKVTVDVSTFATLEGKGDLFGGAAASGSAEFTVSTSGVSLTAQGEAFTGVKATGRGKASIKWKGREIFTAEGTASATAGAGVSGSFNLGVDNGGTFTFGVSGGATVGVGAETGSTLTFASTGLALSATQFMYEEVQQNIRRIYMKEKGYTVLMGDMANKIRNDQVKSELEKMLQIAKMEQNRIDSMAVRNA